MDASHAQAAADLRTAWACLVREAMREDFLGDRGRAGLGAALKAIAEAPPSLQDDRLIADLVARGQALLTQGVTDDPWSIGALIHGFFSDAETLARLSPASAKAYRVQARKLRDRFGARRADQVTRAELRVWRGDLEREVSVSTANQAISLTREIFRWAGRQTPPRIVSDPTLGLKRPPSPRLSRRSAVARPGSGLHTDDEATPRLSVRP